MLLTKNFGEVLDNKGLIIYIARMVFVVVQIRAHCRVVKPWYGCIVADHAALIDGDYIFMLFLI